MLALNKFGGCRGEYQAVSLGQPLLDLYRPADDHWWVGAGSVRCGRLEQIPADGAEWNFA